MIIVHAITKDGPLVTVDEGSKYPIEGWFKDRRNQGRGSQRGGRGRGGGRRGGRGGNQSRGGGQAQGYGADVGGAGSGGRENPRTTIAKELTAEFIFPAGENSPLNDYQKNMDADTFMAWIERRLVPVFNAMYPGKKTILILDNEPYHHGMADDWKSPLQASKTANLKLCREVDGVDSISVSRDGYTLAFALPAEGNGFEQFPAGPSVKELQHATHHALQDKAPQKLETRAERYFREKDLGDLLFTPPYCPALQPIELFWAHGKNYVAEKFQAGRTLDDAHGLLREA